VKTARVEADATARAGAGATPETSPPPAGDRSWLARLWYRIVQFTVASLLAATGGLRASGRGNIPARGGVLLISNHLSHLDVFVLGILVPRPLNYVARSTLFLPVLGALIRSVGGFPIQREGMGASGLKETLRRLRNGGIVVLFPEGTRSRDGALGPIKPGIVVLAARARVPIVPAGLAGTFEAWPRKRPFPWPYPIRIHYGPAIAPEELDGLAPEAIVGLIRDRLLASSAIARRGLSRDLGHDPGGPG
jgi:1-acyl-sn-glycerol-3-phosphate acyltransferase